MQRHYIKKQQTRLLERGDFYTPSGLHVYFKEPFHNESVDIEAAIAKMEASIPHHLLAEVEMIIVGWFEEFDERQINAFFKDGALYLSNLQDDTEDLYDDIIHEVAHSIEAPHGYIIYGDEKIKNESLSKREHLYKLLWARGYKAPKTFFEDVEFNKEFDEYLHKKVGYDKLVQIMSGLFINPYAATSLREYFATGFADFYLNEDHKYLSTVSPQLYKKIYAIQKEETLDF